MKVLLTGGAGFIGGYVARELSARGHAVEIFDLKEGKDIRDRAAIKEAMAGKDAVVHLAALVSVPESVARPAECRAINIEGTRTILAEAGERRIVYASSAAVYGDLPGLPKREDMALSPQSPYAESKVENEQDAASRNALGLRFFNVYGPGQSAQGAYASVIPRFVAEAKAGRPLRLEGGGRQTRDFVHARDVARAAALSLESDARGVCNIASGQPTSIRQLAELVRERYPVELIDAPERPGDIRESVADISRAKDWLGFAPQVSFEEGMRELLL